MKRFQKQIKFLKIKKRKMMKIEFRNINDLKKDEKTFFDSFFSDELLVNVQFEKLELLENFAN